MMMMMIIIIITTTTIIIIIIIISHTVLHDQGTLVLSESGVQSEVCELRQGNCTWPYHLQVSLDIT